MECGVCVCVCAYVPMRLMMLKQKTENVNTDEIREVKTTHNEKYRRDKGMQRKTKI